MSKSFGAVGTRALAMMFLSVAVWAADAGETPRPAESWQSDRSRPIEERRKDDYNLPPFPPDVTVHQSMHLGGALIKYDATVGSLPVQDERGKTIGSVMFTAYIMPGAGRPVTFVLNGGPGASSVFLNLGALVQSMFSSVPMVIVRPTPSSRPTMPARGWTSPTSCSSIRWVPVSAILV